MLRKTTNATNNGEEAKPYLSETATESNIKHNESGQDQSTMAVEQQTRTADGHVQTGTDRPKKRKKKGFLQRGPTALTRNRGTGFEGKCSTVTSLA